MSEEEIKKWGTLTSEKKTEIDKGTAPKVTRALIQKALAIWTVRGYFILLALPLLFLLGGIINTEETIDLIKTIAAVLGGIVGMIWVFYFNKPD